MRQAKARMLVNQHSEVLNDALEHLKEEWSYPIQGESAWDVAKNTIERQAKLDGAKALINQLQKWADTL